MGYMRGIAATGAVAALLFCAPVHQAIAADMATYEETVVVEDPSPGLTFNISPYFWMAGLSGSTANFGAQPVDIDVPFSSILKSLDFSMMVVSQARYGRFSLSSDLLFLKVSTNKATPGGAGLASSVGLGSKTFEFTLLAGYSLVDTPRARLDVVGGARIWSVETTLSFSGGLLNGLWLRDSATWVDAMAGLKGRASLTDKVYLTGWAIGGGGSSKSSWDLMGGIGYDFNDRFSAVVGYRAAAVDYQDGPFLFDVTMQGPILGAVFRF